MERDNDGATPAHFAAARGQDITQYGSTVTQIEHSVAIAWYELIKLQATLFSIHQLQIYAYLLLEISSCDANICAVAGNTSTHQYHDYLV